MEEGIAAFMASKYHRSMLNFHKCIGQSQTLQARALGNLGNVYRVMSRFDDAIKVYKDCHELLVKIGDKRRQVDVLHNLACSYAASGGHAKAAVFLEAALAAATDTKVKSDISQIIVKLKRGLLDHRSSSPPTAQARGDGGGASDEGGGGSPVSA